MGIWLTRMLWRLLTKPQAMAQKDVAVGLGRVFVLMSSVQRLSSRPLSESAFAQQPESLPFVGSVFARSHRKRAQSDDSPSLLSSGPSAADVRAAENDVSVSSAACKEDEL